MGLCILALLFALIFPLSCEHIANKNQVCQQLCGLFLTGESPVMEASVNLAQGRVGKRGPQGLKGEKGERGIQGQPEAVDYERIDRELDVKVNAVTADLSSRVDEMNRRLQTALVRLEPLITFTEKFSESCHVLYNGKCFHAIIRPSTAVPYVVARDMCRGRGWELANIYSKEHYDQIFSYLKTVSSHLWGVVWTGMTANVQARSIHLSNGIRAPYLTWHENFPDWEVSYTKITIVMKRDNTTKQGFQNLPPHTGRHGALCEF